MPWQIQNFPPCKYDVFLSHCAEDRGWLVLPLFAALRADAIIPWLDQHHYPFGRTPPEALRDGVLACRHTVFLVTQAMLCQARGWATLELAWAHLLQENLRQPGGELQAVLLPLFFLAPDDDGLGRSVWSSVRDRGPFHRKPLDGDEVIWAARRIKDFLLHEEQRVADNAIWLARDSRARQRIDERPGLLRRITQQRS